MPSIREDIQALSAQLVVLEPQIKVDAQTLIYSTQTNNLVTAFEALRAQTIPKSVLDTQLGLIKQAVDNLKLYIPAEPVLSAE